MHTQNVVPYSNFKIRFRCMTTQNPKKVHTPKLVSILEWSRGMTNSNPWARLVLELELMILILLSHKILNKNSFRQMGSLQNLNSKTTKQNPYKFQT